MSKQAKYKHLTETEFSAAKWMLTNMTKAQVAKAINRSSATLTYIDRARNYAEYRSILSDINEKQEAQKAARSVTQRYNDPVEQTVTVPAEDMAKLFTLLAEISEKLDRVVIPKRKFF